MKKKMRMAVILTAGLLAMAPFAASFTAYAYDITVNEKVASGSEFKAYQIFTGNSSDGKLKDIEWGSAIPSTKISDLLAELKADKVFGEGTNNKFDGLTAESPAEDFAAIMGSISNNSSEAKELARVLGKYTTTAVADSNTADNIIGGVASGYYLVKEESPASADPVNPISLNLLKVVGADAEIDTKESYPTLDKKITGPNPEVDGKANAVSIGDTVEYQIDTTMPDMTGYTRYYYVINDTLDEGLTFVPSSVEVKIGGTDLTAGTDFVVQTNTDAAPYTFQIVFKDFEKRTEAANTGIVVTYNAILNEKANRGTDGNLNTANLTYSNNPNYIYDNTTPDDDEPDDGEPVGTTPDKQTKTFTANLVLNKTRADETTKLTGAKFKIEGTSVKAVLINDTSYQKVASPAEDGTYYYKLKDGTFSTTKPADPLPDTYDSADAYEKITITSTNPTYSEVCTEVYVDASGQIHFGGLGAGTYKITEMVAPDGYNLLTDPIYIEISETIAGSSTDIAVPTWTAVQWSGADGDTKPADASKLTSLTFAKSTEADPYTNEMAAQFTVVNKKGSELPSTGGIGTKLFYIFGGMLAIGSGVILVTKKRMANTEK